MWRRHFVDIRVFFSFFLLFKIKYVIEWRVRCIPRGHGLQQTSDCASVCVRLEISACAWTHVALCACVCTEHVCKVAPTTPLSLFEQRPTSKHFLHLLHLFPSPDPVPRPPSAPTLPPGASSIPSRPLKSLPMFRRFLPLRQLHRNAAFSFARNTSFVALLLPCRSCWPLLGFHQYSSL